MSGVRRVARGLGGICVGLGAVALLLGTPTLVSTVAAYVAIGGGVLLVVLAELLP